MKIFIYAITILAICSSAQKLPISNQGVNDPERLNGYWELTSVKGSNKSFQELFSGKKPLINISVADKSIVGYTGCNSFFSTLEVDGITINFKKGMGKSNTRCSGKGESVFWKAFAQINKYNISDDTTLDLIAGDIALMRFSKKDSSSIKQVL